LRGSVTRDHDVLALPLEPSMIVTVLFSPAADGLESAFAAASQDGWKQPERAFRPLPPLRRAIWCDRLAAKGCR